jgi:hypothetical protein
MSSNQTTLINRVWTCALIALLLGLCQQLAVSKEALWIEGEDRDPYNSGWNNHPWWYHHTDLDMNLLSPGTPGVSPGDWYVHYTSDTVPEEVIAQWNFNINEGGTYTWWIRLNPFRNSNGGAGYSYRFRRVGSAWPGWTTLDVTEARNNMINLVKPGIDIRFIAWSYGAMLDFTPGSYQVQIRLSDNGGLDEENHGGVDVMALVNYPWAPTGVIPPDPNAPPPGPSNWFLLVAGPDQFSPKSITDMNYLIERPAGTHGHLLRDGNNFAFEDDTPVKFWGMDAGMTETVESQQRQAKFYAKHGVNMIRMHAVEDILGSLQGPPGGRYFNATNLDKLDHWFAILKENGIYVTWSLFYHHVVLADEGIDPNLYNVLPACWAGKDTYGYATFIEEYQDSQWEYANLILNHVNSYTGLRYKNDPALAVVECRNEDSVFWHFPLGDSFLHANPAPMSKHKLRIQIMWHNWVKNRYVTDANLAAAWGAGMRTGDSVNADPNTQPMYMYAAWEMGTTGPSNPAEKKRMGDFIRCLAEMQRDTYETYQNRLRSIGYGAITISTAWQAGGPAATAGNLWDDDAMEAIDRHAYTGGGEHPYLITDEDYDGDGVAGEVDNNTMLASAGGGLLGVGFSQVEDKPFTMTEWSECPPNQWKAEAAPLIAFYGMGLQGWDAVYHFAGSRSYMGNGWPSMSLFVSETPHYIGQFPALAFAIYNHHFDEGNIVAARRISVNEAFEGVDSLNYYYSGYGYDGNHNLWTPKEVLAIGRFTSKVQDGQPNSSKTNYYTYWNTTTKKIQSNTGQLTWDYAKKTVTIHSDKTQGVVGFADNNSFDLPGVTVSVGPTKFVNLLFTPLDNNPLIESGHILITALAQDKQYGTVYNASGSQLIEAGGPPLLLEPVQATITMKGGPLKSVKVVDVYGVPTNQDVARTGNTFAIDGRYATYYYEVKRFVPVDCNQANLDGVDPVNFTDFALFAPDWKKTGGSLTGDIDNDEVVDIWDLEQIGLWWLENCGN